MKPVSLLLLLLAFKCWIRFHKLLKKTLKDRCLRPENKMISCSKCITLGNEKKSRKKTSSANNAMKFFPRSKDMPDISESTGKWVTQIMRIYSMTEAKKQANRRRKLKKIRRDNIKMANRDNSWDIFISSLLN